MRELIWDFLVHIKKTAFKIKMYSSFFGDYLIFFDKKKLNINLIIPDKLFLIYY